MSVQGIGSGSAASLLSTGGRFSLPGAAEFAQTLNLGQIIKGKVLRQFDGGNRYLVNFEGHERVVDSGVPLTTGEILHGRVVGIGDRVELQRIYSEQDADDARTSPEPFDNAQPDRLDRRDQWLQDLLSRYQVDLSTQERVMLNQVARSISDPSALGMVGAMISKLGLQMSPELLQGVYSLLKRTSAWIPVPAELSALVTATDSAPTQLQAAALPLTSAGQLADVLAKVIGQSEPEPDRKSTASQKVGDPSLPNVALAINPRALRQINDDESRQDQEQVAWRVINAQGEGAVSHRVGTLPLLVGDQLVEVSVALFEQRRDSEQQPEAKHRQVVFALNTEQLGAVQITARLSGDRVRIRVTAEDETRAQQIAGYANDLRTVLAQGGWQVDEIAYEGREPDGRNPAVASVVEHIALQDSLNRLV